MTSVDPPKVTGLGECLHDLIPDAEDVAPTSQYFPEGTNLAALAAATPFVQRIAAVAGRLDVADVIEAAEAVCLAASAAGRRHIEGTFDHATIVAGWLLLIAGNVGLVDFAGGTDEVPLFGAGPERSLLKVHPLAAWGDAFVPALLGDCDGGLLNLVGSGPLAHALRLTPGILFEVVVRARKVNECDVVDALQAEAHATGLAERHRGVFTRRHIATQVALVRALLVELGAVTWRPVQGRRRGVLEVTALGCIGYMIFKASVDGVWPELAALFDEAGYLPCNGGYVHRDDIPIPISAN